MQKTLGGDRLGSGKKMKVELHNYERATFDMGYIWRSTMSAGTLVPFLCEIALPGDTFDIDLEADLKTHPTLGPLFGSYKVQLDIFQAPIRLYNSLLHNNMLGIGLDMSKVKLPQYTLTAPPNTELATDIDNSQVNPSSIVSYMGVRGVGANTTESNKTRTFNALPILAYWEIYKNYYANKQEEIGAVIHNAYTTVIETVTTIEIAGTALPEYPTVSVINDITFGSTIEINYSGTAPLATEIYVNLVDHGPYPISAFTDNLVDDGISQITGTITTIPVPEASISMFQWRYKTVDDVLTLKPRVVTFELNNIDDMRKAILAYSSETTPYNIGTLDLPPYKWIGEVSNGIPNILSSQEGLACKTYQSDLFNNWLQTEWIDGDNGISAVTAVDTTGGSFTIDTLNLSKKVYDMMTRIAVSGGTYDDWLDAVYAHERYQRAESPMYMGGLIKELVFAEVVNNSGTAEQPLGSLAGKGVMGNKHKGGKVVVKVDEPSYIIGLASLTPRLDYSQGNKWDASLQTLDDLHKPALDQIGFQDLITEQMAFWSTLWDEDTSTWIQKSAGKQPAWINYMTNVNQTRGNFAIAANEMFMTLNRRYTPDTTTFDIQDLTTYIDPSLYNFIFAETALDSQNFWAQIAVDITARRKMSAKLMPNL